MRSAQLAHLICEILQNAEQPSLPQDQFGGELGGPGLGNKAAEGCKQQNQADDGAEGLKFILGLEFSRAYLALRLGDQLFL